MKHVTVPHLLLVILSLVVLGGFAWSTSRTRNTPLGLPALDASPNITKSWKAFTNKTYDYSFKYPLDLEFTQENATLDKSDHVALAYKPDTSESEVRFGLHVVYPGHLDTLPPVKDALATGDLEKFAQYLWDSNKNDVNPDTDGRVVSELTKTTIQSRDAYTFTVTHKLTIGKGEAKDQDGSINTVLNTEQDFERVQEITVFVHNNRFFITYHPAAYAEGRDILKSLSFK